MAAMQTVAELPEFIREADKLLSVAERQELIRYLALHPKAGDLMEGTGGVRKLRWGRGDHGKSGGVRAIYYFHDEQMPLYLLTLFAKGDRANLSKAERNELAGLTVVLVSLWKAKGRKT
ncbi:RelE toxin of RelEB toxin-antitoxin system [Pseudorhodoferax soli]|uniref:RelE toxin of RelEB toxin-antitoxin system n=2 Tax=Pseudorhodoferax soli TaxID=545864 RepID=A0A368XVX9_9BURK|nr:RelE toxin of RelEB toxin-antitoxin system [Pseudorhodoferax soli]